jgi:hypothetical protein
MPSAYCRRQAARVRTLAQNATTIAVRKHLAEVALQYEMLAEGVSKRATAIPTRALRAISPNSIIGLYGRDDFAPSPSYLNSLSTFPFS